MSKFLQKVWKYGDLSCRIFRMNDSKIFKDGGQSHFLQHFEVSLVYLEFCYIEEGGLYIFNKITILFNKKDKRVSLLFFMINRRLYCCINLQSFQESWQHLMLHFDYLYLNIPYTQTFRNRFAFIILYFFNEFTRPSAVNVSIDIRNE